VAGDVVGIPNHGTISVGDTLTEGSIIRVTGIPNFAPEIIRRVRSLDAMKAKRLAKALNDLAEEGVTQVFRPMTGSDWLVGVVGPLQIEVLAARIEAEYGLPIDFESAGYETARWISGDDPVAVKRFSDENRNVLAADRADAPVLLARSNWELQRLEKLWPGVASATRARLTACCRLGTAMGAGSFDRAPIDFRLRSASLAWRGGRGFPRENLLLVGGAGGGGGRPSRA
jgi:peptide chain release factor 3